MQADEVRKIINGILVEEFEIPEATLTPEAKLYEEMGLDSLDAVDVIVTIEKRFGLRIEEEDARAMRTLADVYRYIEQHADVQVEEGSV